MPGNFQVLYSYWLMQPYELGTVFIPVFRQANHSRERRKDRPKVLELRRGGSGVQSVLSGPGALRVYPSLPHCLQAGVPSAVRPQLSDQRWICQLPSLLCLFTPLPQYTLNPSPKVVEPKNLQRKEIISRKHNSLISWRLFPSWELLGRTLASHWEFLKGAACLSHALGPWFSTGAIFPLQGTFTNVWRHLGVMTGMGGR